MASGYFIRGWMPEMLNMECLYATLLAPLLPYPARQGEGMAECIDRMDDITKLRTELERSEKKYVKINNLTGKCH